MTSFEYGDGCVAQESRAPLQGDLSTCALRMYCIQIMGPGGRLKQSYAGHRSFRGIHQSRTRGVLRKRATHRRQSTAPVAITQLSF